MTIRETLRREIQENFDARLEQLGIARKAGNNDEASRNNGFVRAYSDGLRMIDALQDSDYLFVNASSLLFDAFRLRANVNVLAEAEKHAGTNTSPMFRWGQATGYEHIALLIEEQARKHTGLAKVE